MLTDEKDFIMPRRARLAIAGIPWHIIQRGNNRSSCFYCEVDYLYYLQQLKLQADKFDCDIHAYCLMTNHVHLLITPGGVDGASLMMKNLGQKYTQYINRSYGRSGTLWEGRFKSCLVQSDRYLLTCYRYIEMNPVRAAMIVHPWDYRWSSYRCNANGVASNLLTPHAIYLDLGRAVEPRLQAYRELFDCCLDEEVVQGIRKATHGNYVLGDSIFQLDIEELLQRRVAPGKPGRPRR